jgi:uncharacterized protein
MPNQQDSDAINSLFDRIEDVARRSAPRDRDAEALIQQRLRDYPPAPYYMAQTILMQEMALREAQERIETLEAGQRQQRGGFLGGMFGDSGEDQRQVPNRQRGPWDRGDDYGARRGQGGGGFLAGAAQTALGVTGGVLLGSAIAGMLSGGAHAAEPVMEPVEPSVDDAGGDAGGDFSDFDIGGDF